MVFFARPLTASMALLCVMLVGCSAPPDLDTAFDQAALDAPYPRLIPLGSLAEQGPQTSAPTPALGRMAALRARAAGLRQPVLSRGDRARLRQGANRRGL